MAALNGGPDAALVVEMVERVRPPARLPTQIVTAMSPREETSESSGEETSGEDTSEEETSGEETDTPGQSPPRQGTPPQEVRDTVIIIDSDSDNDRN